jgi:hypothetical protein
MRAMTDQQAATKTCSRCKLLLPLENFSRTIYSPSGLRPECRSCRGKAGREYYLRTRQLKGIPLRHEDLTGQRFGRLVAIERADKIKEKIRWRCICDCGNEAIVRAGCLKGRKRRTNSCGCIAREVVLTRRQPNRLAIGESVTREVIRYYKKWARLRNLSWPPNFG